jgi:glycosyltransferase involved in cell wall biosynthesis
LPASSAGTRWAEQADIPVLAAPEPARLQAAIAQADIVQVHFWNAPELYALLRSNWPPARLVLWLHIGGDQPPQVVTRELVEWADRVVSASSNTDSLPVVQALPAETRAYVQATADLERLFGLRPQPHAGFNVGYIGTVDFSKMHSDFVALHAVVDISVARFVVCGAGPAYTRLRQQALEHGAAGRFDFRGFEPDVASVLEVLDVFGYPLCPYNYSGAELVLQEAMCAGLPAVVFPYGGAARQVTHNVTGLVVNDALSYKHAIEYLYQRPAERARLGENARQFAQREFDAGRTGRQFNAIYAGLMQSPKRPRHWPSPSQPAAEQFVESLGGTAPQFAASLRSTGVQACLEAEAWIAAASPLLSSPSAGGILHYRRCYPHDPFLRLWAGLVFQGQGRPALAVAEFNAAQKLGLTHWRVAWYLAQSAVACSAPALAEGALATVLTAAPDFGPAQQLARQLARQITPAD